MSNFKTLSFSKKCVDGKSPSIEHFDTLPELSTKYLLQLWYHRQGLACLHETKSREWYLSLPGLSRDWYSNASNRNESIPTLENSAELFEFNNGNIITKSKPFQEDVEVQLTLEVLSAHWYARRGRLAAKNWGRLSRNERQESAGGLKFGSAKGSIDENIKNILSEQSKTTRCTRRSELQRLLAVGETIKSTAIISTQDAGKVYNTAKNGRQNLKNVRKMSSYWFSYFGKYFNIAQFYLKGKAYIMENRNQYFDAIVQQLQNIVESNQYCNNQIERQIGDVFKSALQLMDTKRDKDIVKGLFAHATSVKFVSKIQKVQNKSAIMNCRDELKGNIEIFKNIQETSQVVFGTEDSKGSSASIRLQKGVSKQAIVCGPATDVLVSDPNVPTSSGASTTEKEPVKTNETPEPVETNEMPEPVKTNETPEPVETNKTTITWISCFGMLQHLCSNLTDCQELISKAEKIDAPQPENLLGELLDVVERVNRLSSSLLSDTNQALRHINLENEASVFSSTEFTPIDRDPGCRRDIITNEDRVCMIKQGPFQPKLSRYPRNSDIPPPKHSHFSSEWFNTYPHLEYSIKKDAAFCFSNHVDVMLDKDCRKALIEEEAETQRNCEAIKTLLDVARTLARQGISFHGSSNEKDGNGNFQQIVGLVARQSPSFKRWLDDAATRPHRVNYLSSRSQNEFLTLLAGNVLDRVVAQINEATMFSVIADTMPDVSHVDQLSVVARYVDKDGIPQERLVDIRELHDKTGEGHAQEIIFSLNAKSVDTNGIVFQSYDYTSSMSGVFKGCQAKMKEHLEREVPYFPCLAHRFNTTVEHSCEASVAVCKLFEILQELYVFFTSSTKRYGVLGGKVKESEYGKALELRNLSATRWSARADSIRAVWSSFQEIIEALEELENSADTKTKAKAGILLDRVKSFEFIVMLMFMRNIMIKTKILTKQIQSVDINIIDTLEAAKATISTLRHLREDEENLKQQISASVAFSERHGIDLVAEYDRHHRPRRPSRRADERPETATNLPLQDFYRKEFVQVLDVQINALTDNVQVACDIVAPAIRLLLPPFNSDPKLEDVKSLTMMLPESIRPDNEVLCVELTLFRHHCQNNKGEITTIREAARFAMECESIFPLTSRCYRLILTAPITSAASERSFSKLKEQRENDEKAEEWPELCKAMEYIFGEFDQKEKSGGGLEAHPRLKNEHCQCQLYFVVDSKDAKKIVCAEISPVQKPRRTWSEFEYPDHDWDQSRTNAVTPMTHLLMNTVITKQQFVPSNPSLHNWDITLPNSDTIIHVTRSGKAVTFLNPSLLEPDTTIRLFNEIFLLLSKPNLDFVFRNPKTGRLKSVFVFIVDNGPAEQPSSPLVQMFLIRLLRILDLDKITQVSFAEYHSKRNFVERVHAIEDEALSRHGPFTANKIFNDRSIHPGSEKHIANMEEMVKDVSSCLQQAKFGGKSLEACRGIKDSDYIFSDENKQKQFLLLSEVQKEVCDWTYELNKDGLVWRDVEAVWNLSHSEQYTYLEDYNFLMNKLEYRTAWIDKYHVTFYRPNNLWITDHNARQELQPIPDYVRWITTGGELHYLSHERVLAMKGEWNECSGLFRPDRLLDNLISFNSDPPFYIFPTVAALI
ncbi:zinc finger MYM-type 1-like [Paramuricea clavata]|uniref:Zinc finger MYM-type 1-like n=1 Tax=Paramuricea clavata TaxID=317549 RepID=A0A6S7G3R9_PARCT|nr:zinc finger MYM-type 1-like [Paramuricea clavata]